MFISVVISLLAGNYTLFLKKIIGFLLLFGVANLTTRGLNKELEYNEASIAKAPKIPFKIISMVLLGISVFYLSYIVGTKGLINSIFVAILASIGYWLYYGIDPLQDKLPPVEDISSELVFKTLKEANEKLELARKNSAKIKDFTLHHKIDSAISQAYDILRVLEENPKAIRVARKFLVVYIDGILEVTNNYIEVDEADITPQMRQRLNELLDDVQKRFEREYERLKGDNLFNLDVSIDTLKRQINQH